MLISATLSYGLWWRVSGTGFVNAREIKQYEVSARKITTDRNKGFAKGLFKKENVFIQ